MRHAMTVTIVAAAIFAVQAAVPADEAKLKAQLPSIFEKAADHYRALLEAMKAHEPDKFPKRFQDGKLVVIPPKDWCSGFFPGSLWYLYEYTKDSFWKDQAVAYTERLIEPLRHDASNHDVGFRTYCSAGNGLRLTGDKRYAEFLHDTSAALRTRYDDKLGLIRSWNSPKKGGGHFGTKYIVIIDNMMNLELLEWDAKNGGDPKSDKIARSQADITDAHHYRPNGSAYHILDYDPDTCRVRAHYSGQGGNVEGTWARGHAWGIYGFTMMYRETRVKRYLERAMSAADYWLDEPNLPEDGISYWDFSFVGEERDISASAVTASALLELQEFAPPSKAAKYRAAAVKMLTAMASPAYFAKQGENGDFLLMHSVGHKPGNSEVNVPLNYADYYFLEALLRFSRLAPLPEASVDCGYAPYRMDDFYWENDHFGMRAYGPVIMEPAPKGQGLVSSGFDLFNKCVPYPVLEKWLHGTEGSYHKNHGKGMDNYKVAAGRGCGGIGALNRDGWFHEKNWKAQRVISKTATEAVFELEYETYTVRGTVTAGTPFMRFDVTPKGEPPARMIGPGLDISAKRQHDGLVKIDLDNGFIANYEPEGVDGKENGSILTAIVLAPGETRPVMASDAEGCIYLMQPLQSFTYWVGAGWTGAGLFRTPDEWYACVRDFAKRLRAAK